MNIRQFEYFLLLAKVKSFQRAADQLYLSQPAVSKQISLFEDELGFPLFKRGYREVTLTPEGEKIYDAVTKGKELFEEALKEAKTAWSETRRQIHIGVGELSVFSGLSEAVASFRSRFPDTFITVERAKLEVLNFSDNEDKYDIILTHEIGVRRDKGVLKKQLFGLRQYGLLSTLDPLSKKTDLSFSDLREKRFFIPSSTLSTVSKDYCVEICESAGFTPGEIVPMHNIESVITAIDMGLGVAALDDLVDVTPELNIIKLPSPYTSSFVVAWKRSGDKLITALVEEITRFCRREP